VTDLAPNPTALDAQIPDSTAIGAAGAGAVAAVPGLRTEPVVDGAVPFPEEPTAVGLDLGAGARLVLVVSKAVARQVQVGPPPAEDVVDGCADALAAAAAAAGMPAMAPPAEVAVNTARAQAGEAVVAARLLDGDDHAATVVLVVPAAPGAGPTDDPAPVHEFAPLPAGNGALGHTGLELLHDVSLGVTAELGRTSMLVKDVLSLAPGSVIELDRAAGSPVDVLVNGTLIARGEVVVIDEEFGIRITEVIGYAEGGGKG
jgi:flagellar motor switch protein FliN/FliY